MGIFKHVHASQAEIMRDVTRHRSVMLAPLQAIPVPVPFGASTVHDPAQSRSKKSFRNSESPRFPSSPASACMTPPLPLTPASNSDGGIPVVRVLIENQPCLPAPHLDRPYEDLECPPAAPLLKDWDSFSQGSAVGDFDFDIDFTHDFSMDPAWGVLDPPLVSVTDSIETWRRDVHRQGYPCSTERCERCIREELGQNPYLNSPDSPSLPIVDIPPCEDDCSCKHAPGRSPPLQRQTNGRDFAIQNDSRRRQPLLELEGASKPRHVRGKKDDHV